eukprot:474593_1
MASVSSIFAKLECPKKFIYYIPKPSYHPRNPDIVILSTDCNEPGENGIHEYNLKSNTFTKIYTFNHLLRGHGQFIDTKNESLYMFGYRFNRHKLGVLDLNTKALVTDKKSALNNCNEFPQSVYIPSIHECHILCNNSIHYKMDMNNNNITKTTIDTFKNDGIKWPNLIYVPCKQQLISFGSNYWNEIWYCNIEELSNKQKYNWKLHELKMPHAVKVDYFDTLLAFDNIVFIFYFHNSYSDIWCVDLLNNELVKTKYNVPKFTMCKWNIYVFKDSDNYGRIVNFKSGEHYKISLFDLIPKEVIKSHRKHYEPLIIGYIKEQEKKK